MVNGMGGVDFNERIFFALFINTKVYGTVCVFATILTRAQHSPGLAFGGADGRAAAELNAADSFVEATAGVARGAGAGAVKVALSLC